MPSDAARAAGVTVSIARDPALVRTVRLVAAAVARRSGAEEEFVEEVRLAVGEACALLMGQDAADLANPDPVVVSMSMRDRFSVRVAAENPAVEPPNDTIDYVEPWALLRGLVEDFSITRDGAQTTVVMSWPAA